MGENRSRTASEIKHRARVLGIVYSDAININNESGYKVRRLCVTLNKLDLRDQEQPTEWIVSEERIFADEEVLAYAKIVKKSRRKPRHERGKK